MKTIIMHTILISFLLIMLAACSGNKEEEKKELVIPVKTTVVKEQKFSKGITTSGKVTSSKESKLSFKIPGFVESINVREGQTVTEGQLLASLNLLEMQANLNKAKNAYQKAERDLERINRLYKDEVTTLEQLQNMQTAYEFAKSNLEIAEFNFKYSKITAPSNGTILMKNAEINEYVNPGYPVIMFGSQISNWKIEASLADVEIVQLTIGDSASIIFDAFPGKQFGGKVTEVGQAADPLTGTFQVVITLNKTDVKIASGFIGKIKIYPTNEQQMVLIPIEALTEWNKNAAFVYISESDRARKCRVTTGGIIDNMVVITGGVQPGEKVITQGADYLADSTKINVLSVN